MKVLYISTEKQQVILEYLKQTDLTCLKIDPSNINLITPGLCETQQLIILDTPIQRAILDKILENPTNAIILVKWKGIHEAFPVLMKNARLWTYPEDILLYLKKINAYKEGINIVQPEILSREELRTQVILNDPTSQLLSDSLFTAAKTDSPVLITGPTGTGKNTLAKFIHENSSRSNGPFIVANCATLSDLTESTLFGHRKGSFTGATGNQTGLFELANNGTLVLDEIGDVDVNFQVKLLQAIAEQTIKPIGGQYIKINTRVILATNRDLEADIASGRFRADLYHRVENNRIFLPPLCDRRGDIPSLIQLALELHTKASALWLEKEAYQYLIQEYKWPGNIRQLMAIISTLGNKYTHKELITLGEIKKHFQQDSHNEAFFKAGLMPLEMLNQLYIEHCLEKLGGNVNRTARVLGVNRRTIQRRKSGTETA